MIETYADKAPITVKNFESYVDSGFFNGTIFHKSNRRIYDPRWWLRQRYESKDTNDPIKNEAANGLKNLKYSIVARTSTTQPSQFFIT